MNWIKTLNSPDLLLDACSINKDQASYQVFNPYTNKALCSVANLSVEQIKHSISAAQTAQPEWAKKSATERAERLMSWFDKVIAAKDDLAKIMTLEQGKPLQESAGEVEYGASFIKWFAEEGKRTYGKHIPAPKNGQQIVTIKQPVGVAAAITPWNFPIAMITRKAAPALAAGCAFIARPASQTPLSALAIAELAYQAGIPKSLFQVVTSDDAKAIGKLFTSHPSIKKISFTGSTQVGQQLMAQAAEQMQKVSLELGGNAPFVVFDDADLDAAVKGAIACKFRNAGQTCICANRFYVHDNIYEAFVQKFIDQVAELTIGDGSQEKVDIGPLINEQALDAAEEKVNTAVKHGAKLKLGGQRDTDHPQCFAATVLTEVAHDNPIMTDEIFAPIAPICRFNDPDEIIDWCNDTQYGLASYFYSRDINKIWKVAQALEYGMVGINEGLISNPVAPFGGVKHSGIGREGGSEGIEEYLETKYLCFGGLG
ncbi:NAD-dependent succinate-semialdehyde dehydrogenase [Gayadomonas joobiniege]|uniref:NAD-dependent succinate-semialdehyde dehydrogenase n=1 Tax=Gayadomonas joobiniege TaxID=1234606 RepID=UPI000365A5CA|nr:NAD-dependent succinate-semialdehyde dehydrogenase [Gayadomonas joobiniege]